MSLCIELEWLQGSISSSNNFPSTLVVLLLMFGYLASRKVTVFSLGNTFLRYFI
jgi:hypothetical protein